MTKTDEEVIAEFKKKFPMTSFCWNGDNATGTHFAKKERAKLLKEVRRLLKDRPNKQELVEKIERYRNIASPSSEEDFDRGYVTACDDILSLLTT